MDKNVKAMIKISDVLDDRYKKLCDRYEALKLSHNRKKQALIQINKWCLNNLWRDDKVFTCLCEEIIRVCDNALWSDCRVILKKGVKNGK